MIGEQFGEETPRPQFTGYWIPVEICIPELTWDHRIVWAIIDSLSKGESGCFISNEGLAEHLNLRVRRIQEILCDLKAYCLIYQTDFDGRKRFLKTNRDPKTRHAQACTSAVQKSASQPCTPVHPYNIIYNKEDKENPLPLKSEAAKQGELIKSEDLPRTAGTVSCDPLPAKLNTMDFRRAWAKWHAYRRERKLTAWKPMTCDSKLAELAAMGVSEAIEAIEHSISNGYQGIFPKKGNSKPVRKAATEEDHKNGW